jgi:hypothetical protein
MTVACIPSNAVDNNAFALESDENRLRRATQIIVSNVIASFDLFPCRGTACHIGGREQDLLLPQVIQGEIPPFGGAPFGDVSPFGLLSILVV